MSTPVIQVVDLGKKYHIGAPQASYQTLRDTITDSFTAPFRRARALLKGNATGAAELNKIIWALRNVSFEVKRGDAIGIVGRNGSGKSTLLKVLSRITEPSEGYADIYGRISSLLEVGTGFHPELTGRENTFLNGAILGMKRAEIAAKFDEIVAFSEIETFIDTPVKHYSTGMHVRLAFAVAAHLEPEILIVDEVLSVGDAAFQKKCLGKMESVSDSGRTVLFVSHNMGAVDNICTSAIWLDDGEIAMSGEVGETISAYLKGTSGGGPDGSSRLSRRTPARGAHIEEVRLLDRNLEPRDTFLMGDTLFVEFDVDFERAFQRLHLGLEIKRVDSGQHVLEMANEDGGYTVDYVSPGRHRFRVEIPNCMLYPADYRFMVYVGVNGGREDLDIVHDAAPFSMLQSGVTKRTRRLSMHRDGVYYTPTTWERV